MDRSPRPSRSWLLPFVLVACLAGPASAQAAFSSSASGGDAVLLGDSAPGVDDSITVAAGGGGDLEHSGMPGAVDAQDFDTSVAGSQHVPNSGGSVLALTGTGNDVVAWGSPGSPASDIDTIIVILDDSASDTLQVDNSTDAAPRNYTIGTGQIEGAGGETIAYSGGLGAPSVLAGTDEDHVDLNPGTGNNAAADGGEGDDTILLPAGRAATGGQLVGGEGADTLDYSAFTTPVIVGPPGAAPDYPASATGTGQVASMENFIGGAAGDTLNGNPLENEIAAGAGDDAINALAGEDEIDAGAGDDTVDGGDDADEIDAGADDDAVEGGGGDDEIDALAGADDIAGGGGGDAIDAGPDDDAIDGGSGPDAIDGGGGIDTVSYANAAGPVTAQLPGLASDDGSGAADTYTPGSIENLTGGPHADTLFGDGAPNTIRGGTGSDAMFAGAGDDRLVADDGVADAILDCGPGAADVLDRDPLAIDPDAIVAGCETVTPKPSNEFTIATGKRNTQKGTVKLAIGVPGPGALGLSGEGAKAASKTAAGPGTVNLKVKPTARTNKRLEEKGKAKVTVAITFTPPGGDLNSESATVKLRQN